MIHQGQHTVSPGLFYPPRSRRGEKLFEYE